MAFSGILLVAAMAGAWLWQKGTSALPSGAVVARIEPAPAAPPPATPPALSSKAPEAESQDTVDVMRPPGMPTGTGVFIKVPQDSTVHLKHAPDPKLVEKSRFGPLPQRGPDGERPMDSYARPLVADPAMPANAPRIALVVCGLGADAAFATQASLGLPPAVTLCFAPGSDNLDRQAQDARGAGHEIVLQVAADGLKDGSAAAMSHLLTADVDPKELLDRLHWQMGRFTGYVGVSAFSGASFSSNESAVRPVLGDIADRGLFFIDDGASPRSVVPSMAASLDLPLVRADLVMDGGDDPAIIDASLGKLEQRASERGFAIGVVSLSAATIGRISFFAQKLADRRFALVPLTAIAAMQAGDPGKLARP